MDIRSAKIPLESIPSANDYSTAAAYEYVYPEIHSARWGSYTWSGYRRKVLKSTELKSCTMLHHTFILCAGYFHCKDADSHDTHSTAFSLTVHDTAHVDVVFRKPSGV